MAGFLARALSAAVSYSFISLWGSVTFIKCLPNILRHVKNYGSVYGSKSCKLPERALNTELGSHSSVTIESLGKLLKIKYVANGMKGRPLLLLIHGFPESWYSWRYQLTAFQKKFWVVAVDLPGYGDSDKPTGLENYKMRNLANNVAAVIKALGYEKAVVCGDDWGGVLTYHFADQYPEMCDKVVILNAPHGAAYAKVVQTSLKQLLASWYIFMFQVPILPEMLMAMDNYAFLDRIFQMIKNRANCTQEDIDVYKYYFQSWESRKASLNYYRANFGITSKSGASFRKKLTPPTLIIWGTEDTALTQDLATASLKYLEDGKLEFVKGASHFVAQDNFNEVNRLMNDFLS